MFQRGITLHFNCDIQNCTRNTYKYSRIFSNNFRGKMGVKIRSQTKLSCKYAASESNFLCKIWVATYRSTFTLDTLNIGFIFACVSVNMIRIALLASSQSVIVLLCVSTRIFCKGCTRYFTKCGRHVFLTVFLRRIVFDGAQPLNIGLFYLWKFWLSLKSVGNLQYLFTVPYPDSGEIIQYMKTTAISWIWVKLGKGRYLTALFCFIEAWNKKMEGENRNHRYCVKK